MNNESKSTSLESIVSGANLRRTPLGNQAILITKDKVRPSYDLSISFKNINPKLSRVKHSFELINGIRCLWQPETRFKYLCFDEELSVKSRRETVFITKGTTIVGKIDFTVYKITHDINLDSFYYACDSESQECCDFASAIQDVFKLENRSILSAGDEYVEFTLLQVTKEYKGSRLWTDAVNTFIDKRFNSIHNIFMLLKAFPIEYTGIVDEELPDKNFKDFETRQKAMLRYYARVLHVKQIPGEIWLYKKLYGANF